MKRMVPRVLCLATVLLISGGERAIGVDFVAVRDIDNPPDQNYGGQGEFGSVPYGYRIATYEVTNAQYIGFLLAKEDRDELIHARVREQKVRRIGHQARRRHDAMLLRLEEVEKRLTDLRAGHHRQKHRLAGTSSTRFQQLWRGDKSRTRQNASLPKQVARLGEIGVQMRAEVFCVSRFCRYTLLFQDLTVPRALRQPSSTLRVDGCRMALRRGNHRSTHTPSLAILRCRHRETRKRRICPSTARSDAVR